MPEAGIGEKAGSALRVVNDRDFEKWMVRIPGAGQLLGEEGEVGKVVDNGLGDSSPRVPDDWSLAELESEDNRGVDSVQITVTGAQGGHYFIAGDAAHGGSPFGDLTGRPGGAGGQAAGTLSGLTDDQVLQVDVAGRGTDGTATSASTGPQNSSYRCHSYGETS